MTDTTHSAVEAVARAICCHRKGVAAPCAAKFDDSPFTICQARTYRDDAQAAIAAMPPQAPGWRLVPVEPTEAMLKEAELIGIYACEDDRKCLSESEAFAVWSAMIAAAPAGRGEG